MDLQSFIQSGLLESYVLGQSTAEERSLVERMLIQHPEARTELTAIEQALESYAQALSTAPPSWMKGRILDQIAQQPVSPPSMTGQVSSGMLRVFQVAAIALLLAGAFFWNQNKRLHADIASHQAELANCAQKSQTQQLMYAMLSHTATKVAKLDNADHQATAMVYYNAQLGEAALNTNSLQAPRPQNTYLQFWAIVDGKPVSMGMVSADAGDGWQKMHYQANATAYAISIEDKPEGNLTPTTVLMSANI